jgi:hypothetical protein
MRRLTNTFHPLFLRQINKLIEMVDGNLKQKDEERRKFKSENGIMTQEEREAMMRARQQAEAE